MVLMFVNQRDLRQLKWAVCLNTHSSKEDTQMANRYVKKCSALLSIKDIQIQTATIPHLTPVRFAADENMKVNNFRWESGESNTLVSYLWDYTSAQPLWGEAGRVLKTSNMGWWSDPAVPLLDTHPREMKSICERESCSPMCIVPLSDESRNGSNNEWVMKMWMFIPQNITQTQR